jgi:hypothetical protein
LHPPSHGWSRLPAGLTTRLTKPRPARGAALRPVRPGLRQCEMFPTVSFDLSPVLLGATHQMRDVLPPLPIPPATTEILASQATVIDGNFGLISRDGRCVTTERANISPALLSRPSRRYAAPRHPVRAAQSATSPDTIGPSSISSWISRTGGGPTTQNSSKHSRSAARGL